jgi:hypothetical protein
MEDDSYSTKAAQFMKEAGKKLKGILLFIQDLSSAILCPIKANAQSRLSNCLSRQQQTTNLPKGGMMPLELISSVLSAIDSAKEDKQLIFTKRQQM